MSWDGINISSLLSSLTTWEESIIDQTKPLMEVNPLGGFFIFKNEEKK